MSTPPREVTDGGHAFLLAGYSFATVFAAAQYVRSSVIVAGGLGVVSAINFPSLRLAGWVLVALIAAVTAFWPRNTVQRLARRLTALSPPKTSILGRGEGTSAELRYELVQMAEEVGAVQRLLFSVIGGLAGVTVAAWILVRAGSFAGVPALVTGAPFERAVRPLALLTSGFGFLAAVTAWSE